MYRIVIYKHPFMESFFTIKLGYILIYKWGHVQSNRLLNIHHVRHPFHSFTLPDIALILGEVILSITMHVCQHNMLIQTIPYNTFLSNQHTQDGCLLSIEAQDEISDHGPDKERHPGGVSLVSLVSTIGVFTGVRW